MMSSHDSLAAAHAVCACIAALFTIPLALLAARLKNTSPIAHQGKATWFRWHVVLNTLSLLLIVLAFGLGMGAVATAKQGTQFSGPDSDFHHKLGLSVFLLVCLQAALGAFAHLTPSGTTLQTKHWTRKAHALLGVATLTCLYWTIWEGMNIEWRSMSTAATSTPEWIQSLFWVILIGPVLVYLVNAGTSILFHIQSNPKVVR